MDRTKSAPSPSLQAGPSGSKDAAGAPFRLLVLLNLAVLVCLIGLLARSLLAPATVAPAADVEALKAAAADLEERGLYASAAATWQRFLDAAPDSPDRAELLLHLGDLRVRAEQYDRAAEAFALTRLAAPGDKELSEKAAAGLAACEDLSGHHGEVARLLAARRLKPPRKSDSPAVLSVGDEKLTEADLERLMAQQVERTLAAEGALGDNARRQAALRQLDNPVVRARFLRMVVQNDLFLRRARELKLDQDEEFARAREQAIDGLLLQRLLGQEIRVAPPTPADLEAYYKSHEADFRQPDSIHVIAVRVADDKAAADFLAKVKTAEDFRKAADALRQSEGEQAAFGRQIFLGRTDQVFGKAESLFAMAEDQWTTQPVAAGQNRYLVLIDKKSPARTATLPEVRQFVQQTVLQQRQQEAVDKLFHDLADRYRVQMLIKAPAAVPGATSGEADQMIGETPVPRAKPGTAPGTTEKPPAKPSEKPPVAQENPDNPLRKP